MKVSVNWLRTFVDFDETPEQIAERVTFGAFELEDLEKVQRHLRGLIVGKILESKKHPDADKLSVTKVDIGGEILTIVCGAPNCREGLLVAVAKPGVKLGDLTVETRTLRGVTSQGMILSEREMGLTDDHSGILVFDDSMTAGQKLDDLVEDEDTILDFEITVNRPDALSHLGLAREIAAYLGKPLRIPAFNVKEEGDPVSKRVNVEIADPAQGPRYVARVVEGATVKPSPLWMRALLHSLGQRPINNIVDITNYVLFELGHPLHAFDCHLVKDGHIIVRLAKEGEKLVTLDDREHTLTSDDLLIADPERGVGLAGVMGGANSEVGEETKDILIEAAYFDPPTIRRTAKRHGFSTEASRRFERGADPSMPPNAAARCAELMRKYADGKVLKGAVDAYPKPIGPRKIAVRPSRASLLLGMEIGVDLAKKSLESLTLPAKKTGDDVLTVTVPTYRMDLEREVDLIEEIARIVGYNEVPTAETSRVVLQTRQDPREELYDTAIDLMIGMGFREIVLPGMTSGKDQEEFQGGLSPYIIDRPISPDMGVYRASLLPGILRTIERNLNVGFEDLRLVETGQVGGKGWFGIEGGQRRHLAFAITGHAWPPSYDGSGKAVDLPFIKGVIALLSRGLSLDKFPDFSYDTPGSIQQGIVLKGKDGKNVLIAGLLVNEVAKSFGIEVPVYVCEVDLDRWASATSDMLKRPGSTEGYRAFSRFPANTRDVAFIAVTSVRFETLLAAIGKAGGDLLEDVSLFDLYEGKPLEKDQRSLAFRLIFRAGDHTLSDEEVDPVIREVIQAAEHLGGVRLRS
ncbi:MAG: phenylalanine--tRNA ligase subunit beta [bacterium]